MRPTIVRRISCLLVCSFLLSKILGKDIQGSLQPWNLTSSGKVSDPDEGGDTDFNCKIYSDCDVDRKNCYCDKMCSMYNDCCMNAPYRNERTTSIPDLRQYMTCREWDVYHIWVVTECPLESGETCNSQGHDFRNVLVTDENNITYNNYRCALCHGVSKYSYWTFSITPRRGSDSTCNSTTNIVCDDLDHSLESCIDTLLEKRCEVWLYPPKGMSVRFCIETEELTTNLSCKAEYLPIQNRYFRKLYRNADCCTKLEGECPVERYMCWRMIPMEADYGLSRTPISLPTYTIFTFDKGCTEVSKCGKVKYVGFVFELDVRFKYKTKRPDIRDTYSVVCLLRRYFEVMDDELSILDGKVRMWKASPAHSFSLVVLDLRLKSKHTFGNERDIKKLKEHLTTMLFSIYVDGKENVFNMENTGEEANEYNVSNLEMEVGSFKQRHVNAWFSMANDNICDAVQDVWDIPMPRCKHLNISVSMDILQLKAKYRCLSFATRDAPGSVTIGSTGDIVCSSFGRNALCLLLSAMIVTLISEMN